MTKTMVPVECTIWISLAMNFLMSRMMSPCPSCIIIIRIICGTLVMSYPSSILPTPCDIGLNSAHLKNHQKHYLHFCYTKVQIMSFKFLYILSVMNYVGQFLLRWSHMMVDFSLWVYVVMLTCTTCIVE